MTEWQPIETAPKDGTDILVVYPTHFVGRPSGDFSIVRWENNKWIAQADGQRAIEAQNDFRTEYICPFFTHWMPLPSPPKEG